MYESREKLSIYYRLEIFFELWKKAIIRTQNVFTAFVYEAIFMIFWNDHIFCNKLIFKIQRSNFCLGAINSHNLIFLKWYFHAFYHVRKSNYDMKSIKFLVQSVAHDPCWMRSILVFVNYTVRFQKSQSNLKIKLNFWDKLLRLVSKNLKAVFDT